MIHEVGQVSRGHDGTRKFTRPLGVSRGGVRTSRAFTQRHSERNETPIVVIPAGTHNRLLDAIQQSIVVGCFHRGRLVLENVPCICIVNELVVEDPKAVLLKPSCELVAARGQT